MGGVSSELKSEGGRNGVKKNFLDSPVRPGNDSAGLAG